MNIENKSLHYTAPADSQPVASPQPQAAFNIALTVPDEIKIRMVDASALSDYEMWIFLASILSSAAVGFFVPYVQSWTSEDPLGTAYFWISAMFAVAFAGCLGKSISIRLNLTRRGKIVRLKTTGVEE